jgi:tRNA/tmRNA/rRNA uracil-C5-methylase (TrmA/RlmC/RlmD family)
MASNKKRRRSDKTVWAYAYQILPPQSADRLRAIQTLLDREHVDAEREARTWAGRIVLEQKVTLILVVTDSPEQDREINERLAAEVKQLQAAMLITTPLAVADDVPLPSSSPSRS